MSLFAADNEGICRYAEADNAKSAQNIRPQACVFVSLMVYHIVASKGGAFGYNPKKFPDTYTLDSRSDTEICFHVTGYYVDSPDEQDYSTTLSFPIKLTLTDNGWRFSQYADAGLDEPYNATSSSVKPTAVSALSFKSGFCQAVILAKAQSEDHCRAGVLG